MPIVKRSRAFPNSPMSIRKSKDSYFRTIIGQAHVEKKIQKQTIAKAANITTQSLRNKLDRPETITLGELRGMRELLGFTPEELDKMI